MAIKEGFVNLHIVVPEDLIRRYQVATFRIKQAGDRQASVNRYAVRALEAFVDKLEREADAAEKKARK
jgi:cell division protein FtsB